MSYFVRARNQIWTKAY